MKKQTWITYGLSLVSLCIILFVVISIDFLVRGDQEYGHEAYAILEFQEISVDNPALHSQVEKKFKLRIADERKELIQGLSGTDSLPHDEAMLFVFEKPGIYSFWMKDMKYPIDIVWLDEKFNVVHVEYNVTPESYPRMYTPRVPALYVLEFNAGSAQGAGIDIGKNIKVWYNSIVH